MKKYFTSKKEAIAICEERNRTVFGINKVYKIKRGRNKGKFFVGSYMEWINLG